MDRKREARRRLRAAKRRLKDELDYAVYADKLEQILMFLLAKEDRRERMR